jgi:archaeosine synthase beta-subunit
MSLASGIRLRFPKLRVFCIETRVEHAKCDLLEGLSRLLRHGEAPIEIELAVGLEAYDEQIRNQRLQKGLTQAAFEVFLRKIAQQGHRLKCYLMQKPVLGMTNEEAIKDVKKGIRYLGHTSDTYGVPINIHLNPTFVPRGTPLEVAFRNGKYTPPRLVDVVDAVLYRRGRSVFIYVRGLAVGTVWGQSAGNDESPRTQVPGA